MRKRSDSSLKRTLAPGSAKERDLQAQLASRPDVRSLMHTPLLATMICRRFDTGAIDAALPTNQTEVYEEAVIAMIRQSAVQDSGKVPGSILAELSPRHLHVAVVNLSQLAYSALAKKSVVFTKSALEESSCLGHAVQLGFLSLSPWCQHRRTRTGHLLIPAPHDDGVFCSGACCAPTHRYWG